MTDTKWRIGKSFAKYSKQASASLDPSRKSLVIGGRAAGAVSEDDARLIAERIEGASFDGESLVIGAASDSEEMLSAILALAAALLRDEGRIHRWRGELVDVQMPEGGPRIAVLERSAFRLLGLLTVAVHMNGVTPDGRIWTSQRSDTKDINPGKWDNLAAGMVAAGETPLDAMKREAAEEEQADDEDDERPHDELDRVYDEDRLERPDNDYAAGFYDGYNELYRIGFDTNSRIGGSTLSR